MRAIKGTTISILTLALLAGSAVGVTAQGEEAAAGVTGFSGTVGKGIDLPGVETTGVVVPNGFSEWTGAWRRSWVSSDPRLQ